MHVPASPHRRCRSSVLPKFTRPERQRFVDPGATATRQHQVERSSPWVKFGPVEQVVPPSDPAAAVANFIDGKLRQSRT
jgi:hypothetical protein